MAKKRNCEHLSHLTAKGSSLRFEGAANDDRCKLLMKAFNFPLHVEVKGADVIAYYEDDFFLDDLRFMRENYGKQLGDLLIKAKKNTSVTLADVLPDTLPMQGNKSWEKIYEESLESTERDNTGMKYTSRKIGSNYNKQEEEGAIVKVYSANEFRTNGHF